MEHIFYHILSYHISYYLVAHFISYHIISYHIISYLTPIRYAPSLFNQSHQLGLKESIHPITPICVGMPFINMQLSCQTEILQSSRHGCSKNCHIVFPPSCHILPQNIDKISHNHTYIYHKSYDMHIHIYIF
ncbi:hypothetical protein V6Z12_A13G040800 [Gossypium hirsutum]